MGATAPPFHLTCKPRAQHGPSPPSLLLRGVPHPGLGERFRLRAESAFWGSGTRPFSVGPPRCCWEEPRMVPHLGDSALGRPWGESLYKDKSRVAEWMRGRLGAFAHLPVEARSASGPAAATRPGGLPLRPQAQVAIRDTGDACPQKPLLHQSPIPLLRPRPGRPLPLSACCPGTPRALWRRGTLCPPPTPRASQQLWGPSRSVAAQLSWAQRPLTPPRGSR